jgi:hypothetical protein
MASFSRKSSHKLEPPFHPNVARFQAPPGFLKTAILTLRKLVEKEEQNPKLSPWAVIELDDSKYPYLPDKPLDADPVVVRTVICDFVKLVFGILSQYLLLFQY